MKRDKRQGREAPEPMGIVISRGSRDETAPKFSAFVWGPAPEDGVEAGGAKAA
jgi:hypothetical protein